MINHSCKDCKERFIGCHSVCPDYKLWKIEHNTRLEKERQRKKVNAEFIEGVIKSVTRNRK